MFCQVSVFCVRYVCFARCQHQSVFSGMSVLSGVSVRVFVSGMYV